MKEKFMIIDFDEKYAISNKGRIKNILTNKILKTRINDNGYEVIQLSSKRFGRKNFFVHRLVGFSFIENDLNKPFINHIDGNKLNNKVDNLEWCTSKENDNHARKNNLKNQNKPIKCTFLDTNETIIFESLSECSRYFDCNKSYIHRALKGTYGRTQYKGKKFEYV